MSKPVYLDYNATTPMDPRVLEAMMPWFLTPANAGSRTHSYGQNAKDAVETARAQVAGIINAKPEEIFFTSGATESNNIAILGLTQLGESTGRKHIISTAIEHKAVLEPLEEMRRRGFDVDLLPVTGGGYVEPDAIRQKLRPETLMVSVMHANNETGVIQPLDEISQILSESNALLHTDAAQTFGKEIDDLRAIQADLISFTAHKVYGPKGIGGLFVRRSTSKPRQVSPIVMGGGQERGLRSGTIPVELVVGFGVGAKLALAEAKERRKAAIALRQQLFNGLIPFEYQINGDQTRTQGHVLNITFPGIDSEALMMAIRDSIAISNGSACTSSSYKPSHVLVAMGIERDAIESTVRISWGQGVKSIPVDALTEAISELTM
jgi:cysteine desulfurase